MAKRILLADDSLTIQKVVELTFSDSDYELVSVSNGQKALERVRDDRPDLILADVVMPEKNGYEVCEAIKGDPATSRIPVVLLSGTFEPFDRQRAERIGADAIVSKPFDSQQLLAQVDALLDRVQDRREREERAAAPAARESAARSSGEPEALDAGFSAEDFTAAIRRPPEGLDPFEEEYGRGDVDSAVEAFEKSRPELVSTPRASTVAEEPQPVDRAHERDTGEPSPDWLAEEPEKSATADVEPPEEPESDRSAAESAPSTSRETDAERTVSVRPLAPEPPAGEAPLRADEGPTQEIPQLRAAEPEPLKAEVAPFPESAEESGEAAAEAEEISAAEAQTLFEIPETQPEPEPVSAREPGELAAASEPPPIAPAEPPERSDVETAEVSSEIEMLAQRASIPELTQMFSSVAKNGNELTEEQIERLAERVVEKLSDRVVREIAWEVIPEMAEIVIKKRIKELEAGIE